MFKSIQTRIMGFLLVFGIAMIVMLVSVLFFTVSSVFKGNMENTMQREITYANNSINFLNDNNEVLLTKAALDKLFENDDQFSVSIVNGNTIIYGNDDMKYKNYKDSFNIMRRGYRNEHYYKYIVQELANPAYSNGYIILDVPEADYIKDINEMITITLVFILIIFIMIWVMGRRISFAILNPIRNLARQSEKLANGGMNDDLKVKANDELKTIANSFNKIQDDLKDTMKEVLVRSGETAQMTEILEYIDETHEDIPAGIIGTDSRGVITVFNKNAENITGINANELLGIDILNPLPAEINEFVLSLLACIKTGRIKLKTLTDIKNTNGEKITVLYSTMLQFNERKKVIGALVIFRRIEDIEKFEKSAEQKRSIRYLGEVAASLAHEMRNPLTSIKGYAQYMQMSLDEDSEISNEVNIIMNETERLNDMLNNFLKFAKPETPKKESTNINNLCKYTINILDNQIPENIKIIKELGDIPNVLVDVSQIESVLINLLVNAIDAMGNNGGKLTVRTSYINIRNVVKISINDTGIGIPDDVAENIFLPFFTTKENGNGLGLAICSRIIDAHNGVLEVESEEGIGTTFSILLNVNY